VCLSQEGISAWGFRRLDRFEASEIFEIKRSLEAIVAEATSAA